MAGKNYTPVDHLVNSSATPKESEPFVSKKDSLTVPEAPEQEKYGQSVHHYIQQTNDTVNLPPELEKIGVEVVDHSPAEDVLHTPMSDEKVIEGLHQPITSGWRWIAEFTKFLLRQAHITLKVIHGKVMRVAT